MSELVKVIGKNYLGDYSRLSREIGRMNKRKNECTTKLSKCKTREEIDNLKTEVLHLINVLNEFYSEAEKNPLFDFNKLRKIHVIRDSFRYIIFQINRKVGNE